MKIPHTSSRTTKPQNKRSSKGELRRQEIMGAALKAFSKSGYNNTAIGEIAASVGLTLQGLLHYFPSKVHLLTAMLDEREFHEASAITGKVVNSRNIEFKLSWQENLKFLIETLKSNTTNPEWCQAFALLNTECLIEGHPARTWFTERTRSVCLLLADSFQRGIDQGEISHTIDPHVLANEILSVADGLQVLWLRDPKSVEMVKTFESYCHRLELSLRKV